MFIRFPLETFLVLFEVIAERRMCSLYSKSLRILFLSKPFHYYLNLHFEGTF